MREETRCRHMGYSFRLTARVILYAPSHRQDSTYHGLCHTSRGALAGTRNSSMRPPHEGSIRRPIAPWANALTTELHLASPFTPPKSFSKMMMCRENVSSHRSACLKTNLTSTIDNRSERKFILVQKFGRLWRLLSKIYPKGASTGSIDLGLGWSL